MAMAMTMPVVAAAQSASAVCALGDREFAGKALRRIESGNGSRRLGKLHIVNGWIIRGARWKWVHDILDEIKRKAREDPLEGVAPYSREEVIQAMKDEFVKYKVGDIVTGTVYDYHKIGAFVDIPRAKAPAFLPLSLASVYDIQDVKAVGLKRGLEEEFEIIAEDKKHSRYIVSLKDLHLRRTWERLKQMLAEDVTFTAKVVGSNRGGLSVSIEGIRAFLPYSQLTGGAKTQEEVDEKYVGKNLALKVLDMDDEDKRIVVSQRKAVAETQMQMGIGSVAVGTVQTVKPYGAFVELGGLVGLLHVSQISHERVTNVEQVLQPGDKIKVMILSNDRERGRLSLSTKKLEPTPGDMLRNPALVFEKAEEMALSFRERVAQAEAAARAEDYRFQQEGMGIDLSPDVVNIAEEASVDIVNDAIDDGIDGIV